jgi:hypothetical protein
MFRLLTFSSIQEVENTAKALRLAIAQGQPAGSRIHHVQLVTSLFMRASSSGSGYGYGVKVPPPPLDAMMYLLMHAENLKTLNIQGEGHIMTPSLHTIVCRTAYDSLRSLEVAVDHRVLPGLDQINRLRQLRTLSVHASNVQWSLVYTPWVLPSLVSLAWERDVSSEGDAHFLMECNFPSLTFVQWRGASTLNPQAAQDLGCFLSRNNPLEVLEIDLGKLQWKSILASIGATTLKISTILPPLSTEGFAALLPSSIRHLHLIASIADQLSLWGLLNELAATRNHQIKTMHIRVKAPMDVQAHRARKGNHKYFQWIPSDSNNVDDEIAAFVYKMGGHAARLAAVHNIRIYDEDGRTIAYGTRPSA